MVTNGYPPGTPMVSMRFTARQIAAGFFLQPVTLHSWHSDRFGLERDPEARASRRYSFADAVVIGLVAALADDLNGLGIPVRHAITLCNQLRPFIEDQITRHPAELYVSLDKVLPVAVAHRGGGKPGGWDVVTFNSIAEYNAWSAAQDPGAELPPGQRFWRSGHELLIDVSLAFKRAGASLSRHDVWAHPNEQGADD